MNGPERPWFRREGLSLLTDFYELTMMAGYLRGGRAEQQVSFDYFFRSLPPHSGFAITAGLESFLDYVENLRFEDDDIAYLRSLNVFEEAFFEYLADFRPRCTIRAIPEGTLVFPYETIVQVEGTLFEAQLFETALLNIINYQTLIATKAARICQAANREPVMEFGLRRAHGPDGGVSGSRAAYVGGCSSTSNVLAGKVYGIPVSGTHAHSWVMSYESEADAFRDFVRFYPEHPILLVDTYDTLKSGVPNAIKVFQEMHAEGRDVRPAIRLDSGDLAKLSKISYRMMREAGFDDPLIVASNDLEEDLIADLKRQNAKINGWGVGTHLITAHDKPSFNGVYKLVSIKAGGQWHPRLKISSNVEKTTDPGRKALWRYYDEEGRPTGDIMGLAEEAGPPPNAIGRSRTGTHRQVQLEGNARSEQLLVPVVEAGHRVEQASSLADIRDRAQQQIESLHEEFKRLRNPEIYRVLLTDELAAVKDRLLADPMPM